ncbi:MAG: hypothetical protein R6V11_06680 [Ectothiorhodospiraceae bacterium]
MLTTVLLLGGSLVFVLLAVAMHRATGPRRQWLRAVGVILLIVLVVAGTALVRPGSA